MKKHIMPFIFILLCFLICIIPAAFMPWFSSQAPVGNESLKNLPRFLSEEGEVNREFLSDLGSWFTQHYAFRPEMITADAKIQANLFSVSNTDSVITGTDGWLFYRSTLKDYMGEETLSERGMYNLSHNLSLIQNYVEDRGARFLFLVPPNKNSLYPQYMPYYFSPPANVSRNRDHLADSIEQAGVSWLDLQELFSSQTEILYLKQDSHWNSEGAILVTEAIFQSLGKEHMEYRPAEPSYAASHRGDLSNMIYPASGETEADAQYDIPVQYSYLSNPSSSDPVSVEDFRIETVNDTAADRLLMYRDSFGNTLLPLLANEFAHAYFSKGVPYSIARDMDQYAPDVVIIELVERNIRNLVQNPAIIPAQRVNISSERLREAENGRTEIQLCMADTAYVSFSGEISADDFAMDENIYLALTEDDGSVSYYEPYTISASGRDDGYLMYLPLQMFDTLEKAQKIRIQVFLGE